MVNHNETLKAITGWSGTILSMFFFLSPGVLLYQMMKGKIKINDISYVPLVCNLLNCILWLAYGIRLSEIQMIVCNAIGEVITGVMIVVYIVYYSNQKIKIILAHIGWIVISIGGIMGVLLWIKNKEIIGYLAMIINVCMFAAPGLKIFEVFKTKNYKLIQIPMSLVGLLCSFAWMLYGITLDKISAIIPNAIGVILSIIQIAIWLVFYYKTPKSVRKEPYKEAIEDK